MNEVGNILSSGMDSSKDNNNIIPVTVQQHQIWAFQQLHPDKPAYNIAAAFRIYGKLNVEDLKLSCSETVNSYEILRTCFKMGQEGVQQVVTPFDGIVFETGDITIEPVSDLQGYIDKYVFERVSLPFDLEKAPLVRFFLLHIADDDNLFLFVSHQVVLDNTGLNLVLQDISRRYLLFSQGSDSGLPIQGVQYSEYASYQAKQSVDDSHAENLNYWKKSVLNPEGFLDIPVAHTRPSVRSFEGEKFDYDLDEKVFAGITELSSEMDISIQTVFLCMLQVLLFRYTGNGSFSTGFPFPNRSIDKFRDLIGPLENILPFTSDISDSPTLREALIRAQAALKEEADYQDITFNSIVDVVKPVLDSSHNPIFQVGFRFIRSLVFELNGLEMLQYDCFNKTSLIDMFFNIIDNEDSFKLQIVYNPSLFDRAVISAFAEQYGILLNEAPKSKEIPVSHLNLLPESEKHRQLFEWNNTRKDTPNHRRIHEFFEYQASLNPDSIAVQFEKDTLTYQELDRRANKLAKFLQKYNVAPDVLVGVCLERSCEMMVALLGVLKAGGGYIPMDPAYPKDRIAYIAENSNAPVLITQESLLSFLPETSAATVCIDRDWQEIASCSDDKFPDMAGPDNIAYVIYTSGSTGRPKGVQIPHGAVANLMASMAREPGMTRDDILVSVTTYSFDLSVPDLYLPLYTGARTVFVKTEIAADGAQLAKILKETKATFMQATPSTWMLLVDSGWEGSKDLTALCGGEAWPEKLARSLVPRVKALWNMYGPTETTVWSTCHHIEEPDSPVLIGKPMDNTSVYILDENRQLVPIGVPGELYIGGHGVSLGYLARPDLNEKSFIDNPFNIKGHPRIYKTGDSVRYRQDGNIEYLNRLDNQVKIRGLRIELGEIESAVFRFPDIKQGVVVVREDNPDDKRLVSYFVTGDGNKINEKELRDYLKNTLPAYMVPQHLVQLDELPRTPNGKVDRKALPVPQEVEDNEAAPYKNPENLIKLPMDDWFYRHVWKPVHLESHAELPQAATCLIFLDEEGMGEQLAGRLKEKEYNVITVRSGDSYYKFNENEYSINPEQGLSGYLSLAGDLAGNGRFPDRIAHLWMITGKETFRPGSSFFHRNLEHGFYSILYIIQAFNKEGLAGRTQLMVALNGSQKVYRENIPYPEKACVPGAVMAVARELPQIKTSIVDFDYPAKKNQTIINRLRRKGCVKRLEQELLVPAENELIAYRKGQRFVKQYEQFSLPSDSTDLLRKGGVYLITGGLGKKGRQIANYLAENYQARLIIADKKQLPERKDWDDFLNGNEDEAGVAKDIRSLVELESHGHEVIFYSSDIADVEKMRILVEEIQKQLGVVNGVIHAASMDISVPLIDQDDHKIEQCFSARLKGTLALDQLFRKSGLDFLLLFSTIDPVTEGFGGVGSAAAGAFMDAYAESRAFNNKCKTICLEWGTWNHDGQKGMTVQDNNADSSVSMLTDDERFTRYIITQGIKPDEGCLVFERSLTAEYGTLVASPVSLPEYSAEIESRYSGIAGDDLVEPGDDIERTLVEYWKEIIGIRHLGVRQNFFDVGGHSLTAVRLFAKIKEKYNIQWPLAVLFEAPTIEECARLIREEMQDENQNNSEKAVSQDFQFLVKMHQGPGNDSAPVYIAAGAFGNVLNLRHLAQLIGNDRPVYGLQAKGLLGCDLPHETYEEAAEDYLEEIRKVQPEGPYTLAGFCSGGTIVYEIAQQLIEKGEAVSHVIMMDTIAPDWREVMTRKDKMYFHITSLKKTGIKYPFTWFINRVKWEWFKIKEKAGWTKEQTGPAVFRGKAIFDATLRAEDRYKPRAYDGKVTLFRPRLDKFVHLDGGRVINRKREFVRHDNGWSPHIKNFDIHEIAAEPGDHDGFVLEPAVRDLYFKLKNILNEK